MRAGAEVQRERLRTGFARYIIARAPGRGLRLIFFPRGSFLRRIPVGTRRRPPEPRCCRRHGENRGLCLLWYDSRVENNTKYIKKKQKKNKQKSLQE